MELEDIVMKVMLDGGEFYIPARSASLQESLRTSAFYIRKKAGKQPGFDRLARKVVIQKVEKDGEFYVRIGHRSDIPVYIMKEGKLVLFAEEKEVSQADDTERIIFLMRKEGRSEEEIEEFLKGEGGDGADAKEG